jgi:hypothetical protein
MGAAWRTGQGLAHRPQRQPRPLRRDQSSHRPSRTAVPQSPEGTRLLRLPPDGAPQLPWPPCRPDPGQRHEPHRASLAASRGEAGHHLALAADAVAAPQPDGSSLAGREAERLREPAGHEHRRARRPRPPPHPAPSAAFGSAQGRRPLPPVLAPVGTVKILPPTYLDLAVPPLGQSFPESFQAPQPGTRCA